jgi:hypothetical protein
MAAFPFEEMLPELQNEAISRFDKLSRSMFLLTSRANLLKLERHMKCPLRLITLACKFGYEDLGFFLYSTFVVFPVVHHHQVPKEYQNGSNRSVHYWTAVKESLARSLTRLSGALLSQIPETALARIDDLYYAAGRSGKLATVHFTIRYAETLFHKAHSSVDRKDAIAEACYGSLVEGHVTLFVELLHELRNESLGRKDWNLFFAHSLKSGNIKVIDFVVQMIPDEFSSVILSPFRYTTPSDLTPAALDWLKERNSQVDMLRIFSHHFTSKRGAAVLEHILDKDWLYSQPTAQYIAECAKWFYISLPAAKLLTAKLGPLDIDSISFNVYSKSLHWICEERMLRTGEPCWKPSSIESFTASEFLPYLFHSKEPLVEMEAIFGTDPTNLKRRQIINLLYRRGKIANIQPFISELLAEENYFSLLRERRKNQLNISVVDIRNYLGTLASDMVSENNSYLSNKDNLRFRCAVGLGFISDEHLQEALKTIPEDSLVQLCKLRDFRSSEAVVAALRERKLEHYLEPSPTPEEKGFRSVQFR